ncbi:MAG: pyrroline-5-carboxylate reductase [Notoacmeibacter sp.]
MQTILLAGCGNMGFAMLKGWLDKGAALPENVMVVEPNEGLRNRAAGLGVATSETAAAFVAHKVDLLMIALKPQILETALPEYQSFTNSGATLITVAAGAPIALYTRILGTIPVIRTMPNTPAAIGAGMIGMFSSVDVSQEAKAFARQLLEANGVVDQLNTEAMIDTVTAVSGSGPAYLFHFIECMAAAAEAAGMNKDQAIIYARQTVFGAAKLAEQASEDAAQLRVNVTSPKGTTYAALQVLMGEKRLENLLIEAVNAAKERAEELGRG